MTFPPPGYDDETVVPQERLKFLLTELEGELGKIQSVFHQHFPGQFQVPADIAGRFWRLKASAEELGSEYTFLVDKIVTDYEHFQRSPDQSKLDQLFSDVKSLQLLLVG